LSGNKIWKIIKERKLSVVGLVLILIATFGSTNETVQSNLQPIIGSIEQIKPYLRTDEPQPMPGYVVMLYQWPFLVTGIIGGTLILFDILVQRKKDSILKEM
jgi:hypothetical protein